MSGRANFSEKDRDGRRAKGEPLVYVQRSQGPGGADRKQAVRLFLPATRRYCLASCGTAMSRAWAHATALGAAVLPVSRLRASATALWFSETWPGARACFSLTWAVISSGVRTRVRTMKSKRCISGHGWAFATELSTEKSCRRDVTSPTLIDSHGLPPS